MKRELIIGKYTLESLTNGMYASPLDMYREYIQNSVDSCDDAVETGIEIADKLAIDIVIDEYRRNAHFINEALDKIKSIYLPNA